MVRTKAPLASLKASGAIAGVVAFAQTKRRNYAKRSTAPKQPRTQAQVGRRAAIAFITKAWKDIPAPFLPYWQPLADLDNLSRYHAYLKFNARAWSIGTYPTIRPNFTFPVDAATGITLTPTARNRTIEVAAGCTTINFNWGMSLHRSVSTGFTPTYDNVRAFVFMPPNPIIPWIDGPLEPDTYYYRAIPFQSFGAPGTPSAEYSATIV